jgi:hypothetical protein
LSLRLRGARPLKRVIQKSVQDPLAEFVLSGRIKDGDRSWHPLGARYRLHVALHHSAKFSSFLLDLDAVTHKHGYPDETVDTAIPLPG